MTINCNSIEKLLLAYANKARRKNGLSQLKMDSGLRVTARMHSKKMAASGKIWHGNDVHIANQKIRPKGILDSILCFFHHGTSGENVGLMPLGRVKGFKKTISSARDIALAQHKSWMRSSGHRKNILTGGFSLAGMGVVRKGHKFFCTQLFYG